MRKAIFNYKAIIKILAIILFILGLSMIIPWLYATFTGDIACKKAFRICSIVLLLLGGSTNLLIRVPSTKFKSREGYITVSFCWILASIIGSFPYVLSGFMPDFIDAFFESTAGFTTTGCSAATDNLLPNSLLLWKAISHWLGGIGILVLIISILPTLGINSHYILKAESPTPFIEKIAIRLTNSAKLLCATYFILTICEFVLLMLSNKISSFDAIVHTMGSVSTGGLVVNPDGIAHYDSLYIEFIISTFCILASINFALYPLLFSKNPLDFIRNVEVKVFLLIIFFAITICSINLAIVSDINLLASFRESFFQVISTSTTTGFIRSENIAWPTTCKIIFILLLFIGGCASSTAGSIKVTRVILMIKILWRGCIKKIHPRSVVALKLNGKSYSVPLVTNITTFILTFMAIFVISVFVISFQGLSLEKTITIAISTLSNTGTSFSGIEEMGDFSSFNPLIKFYLSGLMIIGRLELFTIIILFTRNFWGKNR